MLQSDETIRATNFTCLQAICFTGVGFGVPFVQFMPRRWRVGGNYDPDGDVAVQLVNVLGLGSGLRNFLRSALSGLPWGSARRGPAGETTAKFICWTFGISLKVWDSGGRQTPNTGPSSTNSVFMLKVVAPAYGFDVGNVGCLVFGEF